MYCTYELFSRVFLFHGFLDQTVVVKWRINRVYNFLYCPENNLFPVLVGSMDINKSRESPMYNMYLNFREG